MESMVVKECDMETLKIYFHLQHIGKNRIILKSMWNQFEVRVRPCTEFNCLTQGTNGKKKKLLGVVKCAEFLDQLRVYHLVTKDSGPLEAVGHLSKVEENYDDIISKDDAVQTE
jgi:hypothetical protein